MNETQDILTLTFNELGVVLLDKRIPERENRLTDILYAVESFGVLLLPPTDNKREAEAVYQKSNASEKVLLLQIGVHRSVLLTNAPYRYNREELRHHG